MLSKSTWILLLKREEATKTSCPSQGMNIGRMLGHFISDNGIEDALLYSQCMHVRRKPKKCSVGHSLVIRDNRELAVRRTIRLEDGKPRMPIQKNRRPRDGYGKAIKPTRRSYFDLGAWHLLMKLVISILIELQYQYRYKNHRYHK